MTDDVKAKIDKFEAMRLPEGEDVPVLAILKRHLETSVLYQEVASRKGNPQGFAYVQIPDWEVRQIIEFLERQNKANEANPTMS